MEIRPEEVRRVLEFVRRTPAEVDADVDQLGYRLAVTAEGPLGYLVVVYVERRVSCPFTVYFLKCEAAGASDGLDEPDISPDESDGSGHKK